MTPDQFMLLLCIVIAVVGVVAAVVAWRGRWGYGRVAHGLALTVAAVGLYLSGLLQLLWQGVKATVEWMRSITPDTTVWTGVSFLGAALLIFAIGLFLNSRDFGRATAEERTAAKTTRKAAASAEKAAADKGKTAVAAPTGKAQAPSVRTTPAADDLDDMTEIEAILKGRGIQ